MDENLKKLHILGIESSCDDTGAAILDSERNILSNVVISQDKDHNEFRGVVPEIAARLHLTNLEKATNLALQEAGLELQNVDAIAATCGPGLIGGVIAGTMLGKSLASVLDKPFIAVNHLEGHALTCRLSDTTEYPFLLLLVSGGHCQFVAVQGLGKYKILGATMDDAVGEAFDKVARMLGLSFPGGPQIEKYAKRGDANRFDFPKPIYHQKNCDMSFSGLKTAVRLSIEEIILRQGNLTEQDIADISASFQKVVADILVKKMSFAIDYYEELCEGKRVVVGGGVAANMCIREVLTRLCELRGYNFVAPPLKLCTDNAAMIAFAGLERLNAGIINNIDFRPRARWSLEDI